MLHVVIVDLRAELDTIDLNSIVTNQKYPRKIIKVKVIKQISAELTVSMPTDESHRNTKYSI